MTTRSTVAYNRFEHEVPARLLALTPGRLRVLCGQHFPDYEGPNGRLAPCQQVLGIAHHCASDPDLLTTAAAIAVHAGLPLPSRDSWVLRAEREQHYAPDGAGRFRIARPRRPEIYRRRWSWHEPVGRRPLPAALRAAGLATGVAGAHRVVGHFPVLPAAVICPRCGQPNRVGAPDLPGDTAAVLAA